MGLEQHFMRLQQIGPDDEGAAVAKLEVGHLPLHADIADDLKILAQVKLERLARGKGQKHEDATSGGLPQPFALLLSGADERRHAVAGTVTAKADEIGLHTLHRKISRIGICSRLWQSWINAQNAMPNTPFAPVNFRRESVQTWVNFSGKITNSDLTMLSHREDTCRQAMKI